MSVCMRPSRLASVVLAGLLAFLFSFHFSPAHAETPSDTLRGPNGTCGMECYVNPLGDDNSSGNQGNPFQTIQQGLDVVDTGGTVYVAPGTYAENLVVEKQLTLVGEGSGDNSCNAGNPAAVTIISPPSGAAITVSAGGAQNTPLEFVNFRIELPSGNARGFEMGSVDYVTIDSVRVVGSDPETSGATQVGLRLGTGVSVTNLQVLNSSFKCLGIGLFAAAANSGATVFDTVLVDNSEFSQNGYKGIYVEKLSNATIQNSIFDANAQYYDLVTELGTRTRQGWILILSIAPTPIYQS